MTLHRRLDLELPIIQAPMAGAQDSALAAAVSNAGGLGSLPCGLLTPDEIQTELTALTARTAGPFNVNFFCHTPPPPDPARDAQWRAALSPYYRELDLEPGTAPPTPVRSPFGAAAADVIADFKPRVVSFHFGLPAEDLLARVRAWDSTILATATTVAEARWLEAHGADVIIAQGIEAGGHRGMFLSDDLGTQLGTLALVPQIVSAVRVPVVAAGAIADARAVRAARALGAQGVVAGTAYLLCPEVRTRPVHRAALQGAAHRHTALTNVFSGRPARGFVNRIVRELGPISRVAPAFPTASGAVMPLCLEAERRGLDDFSPLWSGQNATGCKEIPAAELTRELADGL